MPARTTQSARAHTQVPLGMCLYAIFTMPDFFSRATCVLLSNWFGELSTNGCIRREASGRH
eukprot:5127241-Alexandrium_andersonii.AAC.1